MHACTPLNGNRKLISFTANYLLFVLVFFLRIKIKYRFTSIIFFSVFAFFDDMQTEIVGTKIGQQREKKIRQGDFCQYSVYCDCVLLPRFLAIANDA